MHFYDFNIGEYAKKTQHLTNEEDLAYRRALDMYYDTEKPLLTDGLATLSRRLRVDQQALQNVLDEFFPDGINKHAEEKIQAYYAYIAKQSLNGKLGGRPKRTQAKPTAKPKEPSAKPSLPTNHLPLTTTQEPVTINQEGSKTNNKVKNLPGEPVQKKDVVDPELQSASKATWQAYGQSYFTRYGTEPVRNAKVSSMIKLFVQRIGMVEAHLVAGFYVSPNE